jgi:hypothetical protein
MQPLPRTVPSSMPRRIRDHFAFVKGYGYFAATLCGLLMLAILADTMWCLSIRPGNSGGGMEAAMIMLLVIPLGFIPVSIVCLAGLWMANRAWREFPCQDIRTALKLSGGGLLTAVLCYGLCFATLILAGM